MQPLSSRTAELLEHDNSHFKPCLYSPTVLKNVLCLTRQDFLFLKVTQLQKHLVKPVGSCYFEIKTKNILKDG